MSREVCFDDEPSASAILNAVGLRLMNIDGVVTVGLWSDLDSAVVREALRVLGLGDAPVRYVDGSGIPDRYKLRHVDGDPVPLNVLRAMERCPDEPWKVRDELLLKMGCPKASSWDAWIRRRNDRIFSCANTGAPVVPDDRDAWLARQHDISRAWAEWMRWRNRFPEEADRWRREHAGDRGDLDWLAEGVAG